jgi:broad specificity phosphatase PhoE
MRLVLLCHGATAATRAAAFPRDEPLEPAALARTQALAATLPRVAAVRCSPALACRQTAKALGLSAKVEPALDDWQSGRWAGHTLAAIQQQEPEALAAWRNDPAAAPHGGESLAALLERVGGWLRSLDEQDDPLLAITHAAVVRAALVQAIAATPVSFWRIDVAPLSQTLLIGAGVRWTLRALRGAEEG